MARKVTLLSLFVSSPSDLPAERDAISEAVNEFNISWGRRLSVFIEVIRWETHTFPGIGADPQAVIKNQIGDSYDLFVGILGKRFGTPTGRAGSGTEEEFNDAMSRFAADESSVRILVYFNNALTQMPKSSEEVAQLAKVVDFKATLSGKGVLFSDFSGSDNFSTLFRLHLAKQVQEFLDNWTGKTPESVFVNLAAVSGNASTPDANEIGMPKSAGSHESEDAGFFDLLETADAELALANAAIGRIGELQTSFNGMMKNKAEELNMLQNLGREVKAGEAKDVLDSSAELMSDYATKMSTEIANVASHYNLGFKYYGRAVVLVVDFHNGKNEIEKFLATSGELQTALLGAVEGIRSQYGVVNALPRATTKFNQAKRQVSDALHSLENEILNQRDTLIEIQNTAKNVMDSLDA